MPALTPTSTTRVPKVHGLATASTIFCATRAPFAAPRMSRWITVNSSPARRATVIRRPLMYQGSSAEGYRAIFGDRVPRG